MAEGDTVYAIAARLGEELQGRELTRTDIRVPRFATADLSGRRIDEVAARGKHLLIRTTGATSIHSHLGMDGAWRLYEPGARWRGPDFEAGRCSIPIDGSPWATVCAASTCSTPGGRSRSWGISVPTCSAPDGTRPKPHGDSPPRRIDPSATHCSIRQ